MVVSVLVEVFGDLLDLKRSASQLLSPELLKRSSLLCRCTI